MNIKPVYCYVGSGELRKKEIKNVEFGRIINVKPVAMDLETRMNNEDIKSLLIDNQGAVAASLKANKKREKKYSWFQYDDFFGVQTLRVLISELKSLAGKTNIPFNSVFSESVSPLDIVTFQINKIFPGAIKEKQLDNLRKSITLIKKASSLDSASARIKGDLILLWRGEVNIIRYVKHSISVFNKVLIENNKDFRDGYEYYRRQNELHMKQYGKFYFDPLLESLSKTISFTNKISFKDPNYDESNIKLLSIYAYILTCIHKEELDYKTLGKLFAFLDLELLVIRKNNAKSTAEEESTVIQALDMSAPYEASKKQINEIQQKMIEITGDNKIIEPFIFKQDSLSSVCKSGEINYFCSYVVEILLLMLSRADLLPDNDHYNDILKLQTIRQFMGHLEYLKNLSFKKPLETLGVINKLSYLNDMLFNFTYKAMFLVSSKTFSDPLELLSYLHCSNKTLSLSVSNKKHPFDYHAISITPLLINSRYIYCYFDPNLGVRFLYNDEMILRQLKVSMYILDGDATSKEINVNLSDYYYLVQKMSAHQNFLLNSNVTSNGEKYSDFIDDINSHKLEKWKHLDSLDVNSEWDLIFPRYKTFQEFDSRFTYLSPERDNCFNSYDEWLQCFELCMEKAKHAPSKQED